MGCDPPQRGLHYGAGSRDMHRNEETLASANHILAHTQSRTDQLEDQRIISRVNTGGGERR